MTLVVLPFPGGAQTEPSLETVRDHIKTAIGTRPKDERISSTYTRHGLSGTEVTIRSGDDYRTDSGLGSLRYVFGSSGHVSWEQNDNGETVVDADAADEPADEGTVTKLTHVRSPANLFVISELTALGYGTKDYVDPTTWHVVREETITPTEVETKTYDDFRATAGYARAWHVTSSDGHPENDYSSTITGIDTTAIPPEQLTVPPDRRKLVEFPAGKSTVVLPVRPVDDGEKFIVRLMVGTRGLDFLLDTGASGIVFSKDVMKSLGLVEFDSYSSAVNAGRYVGTRAIVPSISIGPLTMHDVEVNTIPDLGEESSNYKVVGLLGFDFLDQIGAKIDYQHSTVTAYDPSVFVPPTAPHTIGLDVRLGDFTPQVDVTVNGAVGTRFTLDTGGAGAVIINDYFRRRYPQAVVDENRAVHRVATLAGVGGLFDANVYELSVLQLGNVRFTDFDALVLMSPKLYSTNEDGIIGPDLFRAFTLYLDYQHEKVYLTPNDVGADAITR